MVKVVEKRDITIPDWFKYLPNDSLLTYKEMVIIFGYSEKTNLQQLLKTNSLPPPTPAPDARKNGVKIHVWRVDTVKKFLISKIKEGVTCHM